MASLIAPENDYRALFAMPETDSVSASVVIPVYNRVELLENVLAGLSVQDTDTSFEVIVVDDGSEEDVRAVVGRWKSELDVHYLRQDRDGRGAGRARNAGAERASNEILLFLDADCIPSPRYVADHLALQRRADNLVVSASRRHIDRQVHMNEAVESFDALLDETMPDKDSPDGGAAPDDWRRIFYRRTQRLRLGDEAFRAVLSGLMSVRRTRFTEVGGFDVEFRTWGGEDTELGWRLWNNGCFVVPLDRSLVLHQRFLDTESGTAERAEARRRILPLVADRIPHRFYRKYPSARFSVPKVTWVISGTSSDLLEEALRRVGTDAVDDGEIIIIATGEVADRYEAVARGAERIGLVGSFEEAVRSATGEVLCFLADTTEVPRSLPSRCLGLIDVPRSAAVRVGYKTDTTRWLSMRSILNADAALNNGLPLFAMVKRRDLMMERATLAEPSAAFRSLHDRARSRLVVTDLVTIPELTETPSGPLSFTDLPAVGVPELARAARRSLKLGTSGSARTEKAIAPDERPVVSYVGFTGNRNLGDEAMLLAARELMPWARVEENAHDADLVLLGGGTLLNADGYYLERVRRVDHPAAQRAVLGTGFRSLDYWGETETLDQWRPFLDSCELIGLRGPDSLSSLQSWGWDGPVVVVGDLAYGLDQRAIDRVDTAVFLPMWTDGELIGGSDEPVVRALAEAIRVAKSEGLKPVLIAAHPSDDRAIVRIAKELGDAAFDYVDGYGDVEHAIETIASARIVVSERLHGSIVASCMGTPFVAIEYRPKVRDFVNSIGEAEWCLRTDDLDDLASLMQSRLLHDIVERESVSEVKMSLRSAAEQIAASLGVGRTR